MSRPVTVSTIAVAILLIPVALWQHDLLMLSFAALIPFFADLKNGQLH